MRLVNTEASQEGSEAAASGEDEVQQPVPVTEIGGQGVAEVIVTPDLGEASEAAVVEVTMAGNVVAASTLARTLEQN